MRYTLIVDIIRQRHILQEFPGRTEADLYQWLCRNREELEAGYRHRVLMDEAAADLGERFGHKLRPARQFKKMLRRITEWVGGWI
jgi:hypothetical protein